MDKLTEQQENRKQLLSLFDEIRRVGGLCDPLYQKYVELERAKQHARGKTASWAIAGIVLGACSVLFWLWPLVIGNIDTVGMVLFWLLVETASVGLILFSWKKYQKIKLARIGATAEIEQLNCQQHELLSKIDKLYGESLISGLYPQKYLFPDAIEYCYTLIDDMRADSIKEAINLYEDIMYKERLEKSQREVTQTLKNIDRETTKARKAAQFAAVASGLSAYYTRKTHKNFKKFTGL